MLIFLISRFIAMAIAVKHEHNLGWGGGVDKLAGDLETRSPMA